MRDFSEWRDREFELDGQQFRIVRGHKTPAEGDHVDHRIEWLTPLGWRPITIYALALPLEFLMWNEDGLYPRPRYKGANKVMEYLRHTRNHTADQAEAGLRAERASKRSLFDEGEAA